jgi:hypothetical protein
MLSEVVSWTYSFCGSVEYADVEGIAACTAVPARLAAISAALDRPFVLMVNGLSWR